MSNDCRICLNNLGITSLFDINDDVQYSEKVMLCAHIVIVEGDGYPEMICEDCINELNVAYLFIKKCLASDKTMREIAHLRKEEDIKEENIKKEDDDEQNIEFLFDDFLSEDYTVKPEKKERKRTRCKSEAVCVVCGYKAVCKSALQRHIVKHTKTKNFTCESCNKGYSTRESLQRHLEARHGQVFRKNKKWKHTDKRTQRTKVYPIQCTDCGRMVASRSAMESHMRTHTGERPFQCTECGAKFVTKGALKKHLEVHAVERERKYTCEMCGSSFFRKNDIISHIRIHTDERPYKCTECPRAFKQISTYIRHKRIHTGERPYSCHICQKRFVEKSQVNKHLVVHSDEKKFRCHLCNKSLKSRGALKIHVNLHTNDKQHVCSFCGRQFSFKGNLKLHMKRKHSEKSGQCPVCHKTWADLVEHMRQHTGEKPFVCKICDQGFTCQRSLSYHIGFKHKNADKFKCTVGECTKSFPNGGLLEWHILKQHSEQPPFSCKHCARGFFRVCDLSRHMRGTHNDVSKAHVKKQMSGPILEAV